MNVIRILLTLGNVLTCYLTQINGADQYTDQNRPYEFGFTIDGQQHRHEKKDKNGIIMGEFGFITADDVYHVTVYATDEQGRFKILSMKNIHLKGTKTVNSARQGHSLQIPSTNLSPTEQEGNASAKIQPRDKITQEFESMSLEQPANACSHCSLPTTSTAAPKPFLSSIGPNLNGQNYPINTGSPFNTPQYSQRASNPSSYNTAENNFGAKVPQNSGAQITLSHNDVPTQHHLSPNLNNYVQNSDVQNNFLPATTNGDQGYPQNYQKQGINGQKQYFTQSFAGTGTNNTPQQINGGQRLSQVASVIPNIGTLETSSEYNYLQGRQITNFVQATSSHKSYPQGLVSQQQYQPTEKENVPRYPPQSPLLKGDIQLSENKNIDYSKAIQPNPGKMLQQSYVPGARTPKQFVDEGKPVSVALNQKPTLAYAQMQIVDKNTDIHAKAPGENEGLPQGLNEQDMIRLLYTFNYTLGFQGHFEEGYSNGVKQGYYFVTGRNGVRTRIDYTADNKGFHPKITQDVLDLLSDDVPKPETEKQEKYGLKGYEFKWLYYPVNSKSR